ncbi:hypothetical protein GLOTRDRAFT_124480 [Gloeophyllum trabeum ATCC 11539]|uniref:Uncharacterized protein n=1 Tax=Gloeophyllum trabeum (strain ATCC 11539 / FP-39264 / Madison 617) TaxID=670483 RepID=S7QMV2_GLOTA|nr:uncharacterized protein GLOTRDRAFT_124480 [Gloeophyllum trabeum ATCC 11539]EPQ60732.1 hypothetical protein GLOTRDRAFT_124480 [Gloeophyllum trabeum ATCC 11539]
MLEIQLSESPEPFPALHAESAINLEPEDSSGHIPESKSHQDRADQPGGSGDGWNISATLKHGSDSSVDLLLPDRPYDVQLSAMDVHSIAENVWPQEIRDYYASLRSFFQSRKDPQLRPDAPLDFEYLDSKFVLDSNVSVRRSEDAVARPLEPTSSAAAQTTIVVTESVTDLESGQKTIRCEVQCTKPQSDRAWEDFLATCDRLTDDTNRKFHPHVSDYETNVL